VDATMRPSAEPASQLHRIIKELGDEVEHLKMEKAVHDKRLSAQDPALGQRRRKDAVERIHEITRAVGDRMRQVYCLMDVLEAHKGAGQGLTEREVEDTLMSVGLEGKEKRGKRVVIAELSEDDGEEDGSGSGSGSEDEEEAEGEREEKEAPWEGISDTESLGRRGGRY